MYILAHDPCILLNKCSTVLSLRWCNNRDVIPASMNACSWLSDARAAKLAKAKHVVCTNLESYFIVCEKKEAFAVNKTLPLNQAIVPKVGWCHSFGLYHVLDHLQLSYHPILQLPYSPKHQLLLLADSISKVCQYEKNQYEWLEHLQCYLSPDIESCMARPRLTWSTNHEDQQQYLVHEASVTLAAHNQSQGVSGG